MIIESTNLCIPLFYIFSPLVVVVTFHALPLFSLIFLLTFALVFFPIRKREEAVRRNCLINKSLFPCDSLCAKHNKKSVHFQRLLKYTKKMPRTPMGRGGGRGTRRVDALFAFTNRFFSFFFCTCVYSTIRGGVGGMVVNLRKRRGRERTRAKRFFHFQRS